MHIFNDQRAVILDPIAWVVLALALMYFEISLLWMMLNMPIWIGLRVWRLLGQMRD